MGLGMKLDMRKKRTIEGRVIPKSWRNHPVCRKCSRRRSHRHSFNCQRWAKVRRGESEAVSVKMTRILRMLVYSIVDHFCNLLCFIPMHSMADTRKCMENTVFDAFMDDLSVDVRGHAIISSPEDIGRDSDL